MRFGFLIIAFILSACAANPAADESTSEQRYDTYNHILEMPVTVEDIVLDDPNWLLVVGNASARCAGMYSAMIYVMEQQNTLVFTRADLQSKLEQALQAAEILLGTRKALVDGGFALSELRNDVFERTTEYKIDFLSTVELSMMTDDAESTSERMMQSAVECRNLQYLHGGIHDKYDDLMAHLRVAIRPDQQ